MNTQVDSAELARQALYAEEEQARVNYMRAMGAKNLDPPLPRSSHLKLIRSGHVVPYNDILALQRDLVVNCDILGNTDPAAWRPTVQSDPVDTVEEQAALVAAQAQVLATASEITNRDRQPDAADLSPRPEKMPDGAQPFNTYGQRDEEFKQQLRSGIDNLKRMMG